MPLPRFRLLLPTFLLIFALLAFAAFMFRMPICEWALPKLAKAKGIDGLKLDLESLSWSTVRINSLTCRLPGAEDTSLAASGITLTYSLEEMADGQMEDLEVQRLDLTLSSARREGTPLPPSMLDTLSTDWAARIPLRNIRVDRLLLHGSTAGFAADTPIALEVVNRQKTLRGQAELVIDRHPLTIHLTIDHNREYRYTLASEGHAPIVSGSLLARGGTITGSQQIDLAGLALLAQNSGPPLPALEGMIDFNYIADLRTSSLGLNGTFHTLSLPGVKVDEGNIHLKAGLILDPLTLRLDTPSEIQFTGLTGSGIRAGSGTLPLHASLQPTEHGWQITSVSETAWEFEEVAAQGVHLQQCALIPRLVIDIQGGRSAFRLEDGFLLRAAAVTLQAGITIPELELAPAKSGQEIVLERNHDRVRLRAGRLRLAPLTLELPGHLIAASGEATVHPGTFTRENNNWTLPFTAKMASLDLQKDGIRLPLREVDLEGAMDQNLIRGTVRTSPAAVPGALQADFRHWLVEGKGEASVISAEPLDLNGDAVSLPDLITMPNLPLALSDGLINFSATAGWRRSGPPTLTARLQMTEGAGTLAGIRYSGLKLDQHLEMKPQLRSLSPGMVTIAQLDTGVALQEVRLTNELKPSPAGPKPRLILDKASAWMLGGQIRCDRAIYDFNAPETTATVLVDQVSLPRINAVSQVRGLQVSGHVSGTLPLRLTGNRLSMEQGTLLNNGNGTIRYQPPQDAALSSGGGLTGYALKALEEFHYNLFQAEVSYRTDGTLLADMHLQGNSPGLDTDRPVHLNINTEQNLLSLLKSLQYSKALTKELDQQIERKYQQAPETDR